MHSPKLLSCLVFVFCFTVSAIGQSVFYAASRSGLNLRESPNTAAAVVNKIPYGAKVAKAADTDPGEIVTEGMTGRWLRVTYEGRPGYVADVYLLPFPPPQGSADDLDGYLNSISKPTGTCKKTISYSTDETVTTSRTLYENGMATRHFTGYENGSETLWVPGITLQQGFVLARLLCSTKGLLSTADVYPGKSVDGGDNGRSITLQSANHWLTAIRYDWCDGACYTVEIRDEEGEVSITFSSGV